MRCSKNHAGMTLFLLSCFCEAAIASDIDLAEWATADWRVTTDGVMGACLSSPNSYTLNPKPRPPRSRRSQRSHARAISLWCMGP